MNRMLFQIEIQKSVFKHKIFQANKGLGSLTLLSKIGFKLQSQNPKSKFRCIFSSNSYRV